MVALVLAVTMRAPAVEPPYSAVSLIEDRMEPEVLAPVHQVDDQFQLVEAFEVGDLRLVAASISVSKPASTSALVPLHTACSPNRSVSVPGKRRLDHAGAGAADSARVRSSERASLSRHVLAEPPAGPACRPLR